MRSCICILYVAASAGAPGALGSPSRPQAASAESRRSSPDGGRAKADATKTDDRFETPAVHQAAADDPEALYKDRENLASAQKAADIWAARLAANPRDFVSAWKLAQARYWLGTYGLPETQRKGALEAGSGAARAAVAISPNQPHGHFWLAANMGALAESFGMRQGIKYRGPIRQALQMTLELDPAFLQGSADRALGRWYFKVPGLFGGSNKKSEEHLRKSLTYHPQSVISHLFLADTLADLGRRDEARQEYQAAIDAPFDPDWTPEDRRFKALAKQLLQQLPR